MAKTRYVRRYMFFFHRLGVIFSVFMFISFWLIEGISKTNIFILLSASAFIYCTAQFIGWLVNCLAQE